MDDTLISDISTTNKDFQSIYTELLDLTKKLTNKWDPSLSNESDPGVILLKLCALIADKNNYNIDKNILECFPLSVTQDGNARKLYDMLGYNMHWYKSASTTIGFQLKKSTNIPEEGYTINRFQSVIDATGEYVYTIIDDVLLKPSLLNTVNYVTAIEGKVLDYTVNDEHLITINNLDNDLRLYFQDTMVAENGIFIADAASGDITVDKAQFTGELSESPVWKRVSNLASQPLGEKVYSFGVLPNTNICYIEFPQDVASLMELGIYIKYTVTQGESGNIKSNILTNFFEDQTITTSGSSEESAININDQIRIHQNYSATNGENPETIDDAYKSFKRTIGTFDTLVTERDYENFIYNLLDSGKPVVSNINVTDRTDDLNYTDYIQMYKPYGTRKEPVFREKLTKYYDDNQNSYNVKEPVLNAYSIVLYALHQPLSVYNKDTYNESFMPEFDGAIIDDIIDELEQSKSVQHDMQSINSELLPASEKDGLYKELAGGYKKFLINNLFPLTGSLITYNKISKADSVDIENNVLSALYKAYNARELEFGVSIDYDKLVRVIENADSRIKTVILNIPTYTPLYSSIIGSQQISYSSPYSDSDELNNEMIARMILSGNVQLFKFNDDFRYDFGQENGSIVSGTSGTVTNDVIRSITTKTNIDLKANTDEQSASITASKYTVRQNEVIQILEPSLITTFNYSAFVRYYFDCPIDFKTFNTYDELDIYLKEYPSLKSFTIINDDNSIINITSQDQVAAQQNKFKYPISIDINAATYKIPANQDYVIPEGCTLFIAYTDSSSGARLTTTLTAGTIVKSTVEIKKQAIQSVETIKSTQELLNIYDKLKALSSGQSIEVREVNKAKIEPGTKYYFILNNPDNKLTITVDSPRILQENEYFIYTNVSTDELIILGSGTQLSIDSNAGDFEQTVELIDFDKLTSDNIQNINWQTSSQNIYTTELKITSLGKDTEVMLIVPNDTADFDKMHLKLENTAIAFPNDVKKYLDDGSINEVSNTDDFTLVYGSNKTVVRKSPIADTPTRIQSRLMIDANQYQGQQLLDGQSFEFELIKVDDEGKIINSISPTTSGSITNTYIMFNNPVILSGGENLDAQVINDYGQAVYSLKAYSYTKGDFSDIDDLDGRDSDGLIILKGDGTFSLNFSFDAWPEIDGSSSKNPAYSYLIPIYVTVADPGDSKTKSIDFGTFTIVSANSIISDNDDDKTTNISINSGISRAYVLQSPVAGAEKLTIKLSGFTANDSVIIGNINKLDGYNFSEIEGKDINYTYELTDDNVKSILKHIAYILPNDSSSQFNWAYEVPEADKVLYPTTAEAYWNLNHIYNKYILPKIDFDKTKIKVNPGNIV